MTFSQIKKAAGAITVGTFLLFGCSAGQSETAQPEKEEPAETGFMELEKEYDARLGVYVLDTGSNQSVSYREDERFIYASTHKALAVGALLREKSLEDLEEVITYTEEDLVNYNPITEKHVDTGMTLKELSDASIRYSDNTAGNLIFSAIGGPEGFKEVLREIGDNTTEPERIEPDLNDVKPGETRDTSTPKALAESLQAFTLGDALPPEKQDFLNDMLVNNTTGDALIRAGVPEGWTVGDKTGAGSYGTRNDIAIAWPPEGDPIIIAILSSRDEKDSEYEDALIAKATKEALKQLEQ